MKDKTTAAVLAFLLGSFGVHKFYLEQPGMGCLYFLLFFTGIPQILGWIEGFMLLMMSDAEFNRRYNWRQLHAQTGFVQTVTISSDGVRTVQRQSFGTEADETVPQTVPRGRPVDAGGRDVPDEYRRRRPRDAAERERFTLQAAAANDGRLTASELTLLTHLSLSEAKQTLDALHRHGACEIDVDAHGGIHYHFPELAADPPRRQTGVSDDVAPTVRQRMTGSGGGSSANPTRRLDDLDLD